MASAQVPPPPPPAIGGTPCGLLISGSTVPAGFAPAYNVLSSARELLVQVYCGTSGASVSAGTGASDQIVYNTGYKWMASQNQWAPITFTGTNYSGSTAWLANTGSAPISSSQVESGVNYVVAYTCQNVNSQWKCGCSDQACSTNKWQLQSFNSTGGTTGGGGTGGGGASGTTLTNLRNVFAYKFQVIPSGSGYVVVPVPASREMKLFLPSDIVLATDQSGFQAVSSGTSFEVWWAGLPEDVECWKAQKPSDGNFGWWGGGLEGQGLTTPAGTQRLKVPEGQPTLSTHTRFYVQCAAVKGFRNKALWQHAYESQISNGVDIETITPGTATPPGYTASVTVTPGHSNPNTLPGAARSSGSGYGVGGSLTVKINGVPITKPDGTSSVIPGGALNIEWSASSQYKACEGFAASYFQTNGLLPTSGSDVLHFNKYQKSDVPTFMLMCAGPGN